MLAIYFFLLLPYIAGLSADPCNYNVKLHQELLNEGFHRNLSYKLTFQDDYLLGCYIVLDQSLPSGVYAAPDELADLTRMNKNQLTAILKNKVNIELPAEQAQPTNVYTISTVTDREVNLWLPVHGRYYHAANGGGYRKNLLGAPRLYMHCVQQKLECSSQITFPCLHAGKDMCEWKEIPVTMTSIQPLQFLVPIGDKRHLDTVTIISLATCVIMSLYMLKTLHDYKIADTKLYKMRKTR